jgi:hypothetical protein
MCLGVASINRSHRAGKSHRHGAARTGRASIEAGQAGVQARCKPFHQWIRVPRGASPEVGESSKATFGLSETSLYHGPAMKKCMLIINPNTANDTVETMGAECRKIVSPDPTLATPKFMESLIDLGYPQSRANRRKPPLDSPADTSGAMAHDRGWLDEA